MGQREIDKAGIGKYSCEMEWKPVSYDGQDGAGLSEYYFYFDSNPHPSDFLKQLMDVVGTNRVRETYDEPRKTTLVVNNSFDPTVFNRAKQTLHRLAAAYCPEAFRGNEDQAPFMYGEWDKEGLLEIKNGGKITLTPEQFSSVNDSNIQEEILDLILNKLFLPPNEQFKSTVEVDYDGVSYKICLIKTPDKGLIGALTGSEPFYGLQIVSGSNAEDIVRQLIQPALNEIAALLMELDS